MFSSPFSLGSTMSPGSAGRWDGLGARAGTVLASPQGATPPVAAQAALAIDRSAPRANLPKNPLADPAVLVAVQQLQARDREVRAHEQAHIAVAGPLVKAGPFYSYLVGPDGRQYAIGGSVEIDTSDVPNNPEATLAKAQRIRAAALAPAQPSTADLSVAATASRMEMRAQLEISRREAASAYAIDDARPRTGQLFAQAA